MGKTAKRVLAILLAIVVVAGAVWIALAANTRSSLAIYLDGRAFECETGTATAYDSGFGDSDEGATPGIELTKNLDCTLRFHASNDGAFPIEITTITIPFAGPATRGGASVVQLDGDISTTYPLAAGADGSRRDAILELDYPLTVAPGESTFFVATLAYAPDPCLGEGVTMSTSRAPSATVSALGIEGEREGLRGGYAFRGTADSSCDS